MIQEIKSKIKLFSATYTQRRLLYILLLILVFVASGAAIFLRHENIGAKDAIYGVAKTIQTGRLDTIRQSTPTENTEKTTVTNNTSSSNGVLPQGPTSPSNPPSSVPGQEQTAPSSVPPSAPTNSPPGSTPETPSAPPEESLSVTVAFYADNQSDSDSDDQNHQRVVDNILATNANPIFHAGDLMEDGTQNSLDRFNNITATLRSTRTFYAALGNNDRKYGDSSTPSSSFLNNFIFPNNEQWYSVNTGNLHMVILDSAFSWNNSTQRSWLLSDLQSAASQSRITGVMFHHPTFAAEISQYLIDNGVDFVVSGHTHTYTHSSSAGIHYFVTSGQTSIGYLLARIYESKISISAYNSSNGLIETINFSER